MTLPGRPMLFLHQWEPRPLRWWPWIKWVARTVWRSGWADVWLPRRSRLADSIAIHLEHSADGVKWETLEDTEPRPEHLQRISVGTRTRYAPTMYVAGVDRAERDGDETVMVVLDRATGKQVAMFKARRPKR